MHLRRRIGTSGSLRNWASASPVVAVTATAALVVTAAFGGHQVLQTQNAGSGQAEASISTASFSSGTATVVDDPAVATQGDGPAPSRAVQEFTKDEEFDSFALTWSGERDINAHFRSKRADGSWTEWFEADALPHPEEATQQGTELIYVEPTHTVQVSVAGLDLFTGDEAAAAGSEESASTAETAGAAESAGASQATTDGTNTTTPGTLPKAGLETSAGVIQPVADDVDLTDGAGAGAGSDAHAGATGADDLNAVFVNGNAAAGAGQAENAIEQTANLSVGMPSVVTRQGWGANESYRGNCGATGMDYNALTLHHTAGSNNYDAASAAAQVRGAYQYHTQTLGWCDIGYHALVDKFGTIYEGRRGGLNEGVMGAHAGGYNQGTFGISMVGNYEVAPINEAIIQSVGQIAGWRAAQSGFDPSGTIQMTSGGSSYAKYPAGDTRTFQRFHGHRDVGATTCPGQHAVARWSDIRNATNKKYQQVAGLIAGNATGQSQSGNNNSGNSGNQPGTTNQNNQSTQSGTTNQNSTQSTQNAHTNSNPASDGPLQTAVKAIGIIAPLVMAILQQANGAANKAPNESTEETLKRLATSSDIHLGDVPALITQVVKLTGNTEIEQTWARINKLIGPVLGSPATGIVRASDDVNFALFDNGVIIDSETAGTNALWGEIAKAWANGGFEKLGLPTSEQYQHGQKIRVNFQGGNITYDPSTGELQINAD
ncbi:N-acetylmuramoyl-L-alanine amidase [Corynebacterium propinquum]|uniref:N-acetylmuramoyl-L-alanine amidase n=1 Tax=Corynebacterium propinquum TaxID=43769 RepID=UPI001EF1BDC7|nr:N-acetylmuramoyl-L-alanine amidase [Corynebacterium propinquum]MCG7232291.1 N-acetylmuramoyl-L-alanine amidase [Corynebacterium propinquum]MDK4282553.1 N-acetylmuramoyl-L-alanine amidase [Corynebacterium propinquum]MDK4303592.1 N-acetylmuramoyl-L-alanine amidase [Corynebacterium propinquum]MDK8666837.1 N-acetylmuramoyl-L-alanine amidase [Corynebacterium propinquum]MDK8723704.1 N-acetylmuramoyl-L-alanine amidase [Corynebacterium propinquum]